MRDGRVGGLQLHHLCSRLVLRPHVGGRVEDDEVVGGRGGHGRGGNEGRSLDWRQDGAGHGPSHDAVVDLAALVHGGQVAAVAVRAAHGPLVRLVLEELLQVPVRLRPRPWLCCLDLGLTLTLTAVDHGQRVPGDAADKSGERQRVLLAELVVVADADVQVPSVRHFEREEGGGTGGGARDGVVHLGGEEAPEQVARVWRHGAGGHAPVDVVNGPAAVVVVMAMLPPPAGVADVLGTAGGRGARVQLDGLVAGWAAVTTRHRVHLKRGQQSKRQNAA